MKNIIYIITIFLITACVAVEKEKDILVQGIVVFDEDVKIKKNSLLTVGLLETETEEMIYKYSKDVTKKGMSYQISILESDIRKNKHYQIVAGIYYNNKLTHINKYKQEVINNEVFKLSTIMTKKKKKNKE